MRDLFSIQGSQANSLLAATGETFLQLHVTLEKVSNYGTCKSQRFNLV